MKNAICIFPFLFDANGDGKVIFYQRYGWKLKLCRLRSTILALRLPRVDGAALMLIKKVNSRKAGMLCSSIMSSRAAAIANKSLIWTLL